MLGVLYHEPFTHTRRYLWVHLVSTDHLLYNFFNSENGLK